MNWWLTDQCSHQKPPLSCWQSGDSRDRRTFGPRAKSWSQFTRSCQSRRRKPTSKSLRAGLSNPNNAAEWRRNTEQLLVNYAEARRRWDARIPELSRDCLFCPTRRNTAGPGLPSIHAPCSGPGGEGPVRLLPAPHLLCLSELPSLCTTAFTTGTPPATFSRVMLKVVTTSLSCSCKDSWTLGDEQTQLVSWLLSECATGPDGITHRDRWLLYNPTAWSGRIMAPEASCETGPERYL